MRDRAARHLELVRLAVARLAAARLRAVLTMLGVIIGVGSIVALVGVAKCAEIAGRITRAGAEEVGVAGQAGEHGAGCRSGGEPTSPHAAMAIFELHIIRGKAAVQIAPYPANGEGIRRHD